MSEYSIAGQALAHKPAKKAAAKEPKEAHVKKLHTGGFLVTKHHGAGKPSTEHGAKDMAEVIQQLQQHMAPSQADPDAGAEGAEAQAPADEGNGAE